MGWLERREQRSEAELTGAFATAGIPEPPEHAPGFLGFRGSRGPFGWLRGIWAIALDGDYVVEIQTSITMRFKSLRVYRRSDVHADWDAERKKVTVDAEGRRSTYFVVAPGRGDDADPERFVAALNTT